MHTTERLIPPLILLIALACTRTNAAPSYIATPLGTLGGNGSSATSIAADGQNHAFLYSDGTMYDLNRLVTGMAGTLLSNASGINDSGQIVANGCSASLICQAFRLDPIPPPAPPAKALSIE